MWSLTPEYVQQLKEEFKGRRAAIQARHAEELQSIEADLEEIEALERVAYAVAAKHIKEAEPLATEVPREEPQVAELAADPMTELSQEAPQVAELAAEPIVTEMPEPVPEASSKGLSRWRIRANV